MKNSYYNSPEPTWLMRQFWKACGADAYLLERSTYSDQIKYFCLGGIVVATGVMAALAGGYAFYTIFEPKGDALDGLMTKEALKAGSKAKDFIHIPTVFLASIFGLIWGLIIYNIDRFIVTSTGKGDGTEAITKQELKSALPRIIMGMIIALTISKPIEIRMFQSEINKAISEKQQIEKDRQEKLINYRFKTRLGELTGQKEIWDQKIRNYDSLSNQVLQPKIEFEIANGGCKGKCNSYKSQQAKFYNEIENIENGKIYKGLLKSIQELNDLKAKDLVQAESKINAMDGLLLKIQLAHEEAGWEISLFITLLFMVIELTPIFFKMMLIKGPYDYLDENVRELARAEAGIEIVYNYYQDGQGMEAHKVVNHAAELKAKERLLILKAQEELNAQIIEQWKRKKQQEIQLNPDQFIEEQ